MALLIATSMSSLTRLRLAPLAHQGGWDEVLLIVVPVIVLYLGLRWWDKRGTDTGDAAGAAPTSGGGTAPDDAESAADGGRPRDGATDEPAGGR